MAVGDEIRFDDPENQCFGCSQHNPRGLELTFRHVAPSEVETRYVSDADLCGAPGIIHGGVQAAILDEAVGFAVHAHRSHQRGDDPRADRRRIVTLEFSLRYRRPAPAEVPLLVRGRVANEEPPDFHAEAEILDLDENVLTSATARWRLLDDDAPHSGQ